MEENLRRDKEDISEERKAKAWQGKIDSAKIDAAQGATMFQIFGFIVMAAGIPLAYVGNSTILLFGGFVVGFLFLGISYILRAQEVIMAKLYEKPKEEE